MAKVNIKSEKIAPFEGIYYASKAFYALSLDEEPAVIRTFLDKYGEQLNGKVILPFCTSYESPMSEADATLKKGYPSLKIRKGHRLPNRKKSKNG